MAAPDVIGRCPTNSDRRHRDRPSTWPSLGERRSPSSPRLWGRISPSSRIVARAVVGIGGERLPGLETQAVDLRRLLDLDRSGLNDVLECLSILRGPSGSGQVHVGQQIVLEKVSVRQGRIAVRGAGFPVGLLRGLVGGGRLQGAIDIRSFAGTCGAALRRSPTSRSAPRLHGHHQDVGNRMTRRAITRPQRHLPQKAY